MKTDYITEAHVTLSTSYHGGNVSKAYFAAVITDAINSLKSLDDIKKALFYGRDIKQYDTVSSFKFGNNETCADLEMPNEAVNLLHGIIGIATEAGELLEALFSAVVEDQHVDKVNISEEVGDVLWYQAVVLKAVGSNFEAEMSRNINKLRQRFPAKFTEFDANNRNLFTERSVLEQKPLQNIIDTSKSVI